MPYAAPIDDIQFQMNAIIDFDKVITQDRFEHATEDVVQAILNEAGKMSEEVLYPLQRPGDLTPAKLENGIVRTSPGYAEGYKAIAEGGWVSIAASPEFDGMGLPMVVASAVNEMLGSACLSLQLAPLMTQGQIEALEHHASDELKALYLPKLVSGEWVGTMNLTEPHAGSDVGALSTKAEPNGDGTYSITGQKIFISWGDNDFTENVCHLVLARLPDGKPGTKGISLFLVPKLIPDENGTPGERNDLRVVSLEHKMGLHGSPTAVMEYSGAKGWLVGEPHNGMHAMFTMMNNARLGVGVQGLSVAEAAYQQALSYAMERKQGRTGVENGTGTIADHADVRRMLASMKADIFVARAIALSCAMAIDMETATGDADWAARAAMLTPIAKAFGTHTGMRVAETATQVHGGMGFVEETGIAQYYRDVRVTAIYEGTNGIQAMDFVGRKMMDEGKAMLALIDELQQMAEPARGKMGGLAEAVWQATETLRETVEWMVNQTDLNNRFAGAVPFLMGFARVLGGHFHLRAAMAENSDGPRTRLARFYITRLLPEHTALLTEATAGADTVMDLSPEDLGA